jgi:squalene synthase HpnC
MVGVSLTSSVNHYENFPVASWLIPARYRPAIAAIYWFARSADDIADEGKALTSTRLAALAVYRNQLSLIAQGQQLGSDEFTHLAQVIRQYQLPLAPFEQLLSAFEQDCTKKRYKNWAELSSYCSRSANPVGRLVLSLFGYHELDQQRSADQICTALQLINFLQDIRHDWSAGRLYIPLDELHAQGVDESQFDQAIKLRLVSPDLESVLEFQHQRAQLLLDQGRDLLPHLSGRLGMEIKATVAGGQIMLNYLAKQQFCGIDGRPKLGRKDWLKILFHAFRT